MFRPVRYGEKLDLGDGISAVFHDAGHILGSSMIAMRFQENGSASTLTFSGDIGRWGKPILRDPTLFEDSDHVVVESTYGDRLHKDEGDIDDGMAEAVNQTHADGGNLIIPTFAIERAHEIMYVLNQLFIKKRIPTLPVFLDSPMAIRVTDVFIKHPELFDEEMSEFIRDDRSPFSFRNLHMTRTADESKAINEIKGTAIILAGSGMCTGGRVKHHLVHNIERPESTVLFTGYQARGTLGRYILDRPRHVRILGETYEVNARIMKAQGFSGHADREELLKWASGFGKTPERVFVTHGEEEAAMSFAKLLRKELSWDVKVPEYEDEAVIG
jgi:metallo-beta-lactamase family protein